MKRACYLFSTEDFDIYLYRGNPFCPFLVRLDDITVQARIRLFFEWFMGRRVYYVKSRQTEEWIGYCAVVSGINPRYKFSDRHDIVFGHYMIVSQYRGKKLSIKLLHAVMDNAEQNYRRAFAYVSKENIISQKAIISFGGQKVCELKISGIFRRIRQCDSSIGNFILFKKEKEHDAINAPCRKDWTI